MHLKSKKNQGAIDMAKLRWKGFSKKERIEEMRSVANKGWITRRNKRANASAPLQNE